MYLIRSLKTSLLTIFLACMFTGIEGTEVTYVNQSQICKTPYKEKAILRRDSLFVDDFLVLHSLLRIANPSSVFEIGTCTGEGTLIIKNAVGNRTVYSLELPLGESGYDLREIGKDCYLPYQQVIGNSLTTDYTRFYPIEAWFIDGAHQYSFVLHETLQALLSNPKIIIWHDADIDEVLEGIQDGLKFNENYLLFRVQGTRIAYAVPKNNKLLKVVHD